MNRQNYRKYGRVNQRNKLCREKNPISNTYITALEDMNCSISEYVY